MSYLEIQEHSLLSPIVIKKQKTTKSIAYIFLAKNSEIVLN